MIKEIHDIIVAMAKNRVVITSKYSTKEEKKMAVARNKYLGKVLAEFYISLQGENK